jgi:hypothetical protein
MARVFTGFLALAFIRPTCTKLTLTNDLVSNVGEYLLTASANKLMKKNVRLIERNVVVDVMKLELMYKRASSYEVGKSTYPTAQRRQLTRRSVASLARLPVELTSSLFCIPRLLYECMVVKTRWHV